MKVTQQGNNMYYAPALHPVLDDMFIRAPVEGLSASCLQGTRRTVQECIRLCLCESMQIKLWKTDCSPAVSPQRLWLASLSRTETSASICVAAPRPYWWDATRRNKHALCRSTPPVGESCARQGTSKEFWALPVTRLWNKLVCWLDTIAGKFRVNCSHILVGWFWTLLLFWSKI